MTKLNNPLISVIVPIYNVEEYICQCIDSIINQTYKNLEIILVNDGSPDNCGYICDQYKEKDRRIKVIHQENKGLSAARNIGISMATGEYIGLVDSDDFLMPNMYETLIKICIENSCKIAKCRTIDISNREMPVVELKNNVKIYSSKEILDKIYDKHNLFNPAPCNKLYHRDIFEKVLFTEGIINEDEAAMVQFIYYSEKIGITDAILYCYFLSPNSIMRSGFSPKRFDVLKAFEIRMDFLKKHELFDLYKKTQVQYSYHLANLHYQLWCNNLLNEKVYINKIKKAYDSIQNELNNNEFYNNENKCREIILYKYPYLMKKYIDLKNFIKKIIKRY